MAPFAHWSGLEKFQNFYVKNYDLLMCWMCFGNYNNCRKLFPSENMQKRLKTALPGELFGALSVAVQTVILSLFGHPTECLKIIGVDLGNSVLSRLGDFSRKRILRRFAEECLS